MRPAAWQGPTGRRRQAVQCGRRYPRPLGGGHCWLGWPLAAAAIRAKRSGGRRRSYCVRAGSRRDDPVSAEVAQRGWLPGCLIVSGRH
jgi:hypothetical protein